MLALLAGASRSEIADALGVSRTTVSKLAKRCGARLPYGQAPRLLGIHVHKAQLLRLDELATRAGVTRQVMASRLIRAALSAGPRGADRLLGREARPRRNYGRKPAQDEATTGMEIAA